MLRGQCNKLTTGLEKERVLADEEHPDAVLGRRGEGGLKIALARGREHEQLLSDRLRVVLQLTQFLQRIRTAWMSEQRNHAHIRDKLARQLKSLPAETRANEGDAGDVAARPVKARDETSLDRIERCDEDNGHCRGRGLRRERCGRSQRRDQVHPSVHKIGRKCGQSIVLTIRQALLDHYVPTNDIACLGQSLTERNDPLSCHRCRQAAEKPDHRHLRLLRQRRERPRRRAAEQRDELAPLHSITSSASASSLSGTVRPSILAVWWLITSSIFDTCITGKSAGRAPLRMRPT